MLKDSIGTRIFIRGAILFLRSIAPVSLLYCGLRLCGWRFPLSHIVHSLLDVYASSESLFYLVVYLPRRRWLNRPAPAYLPINTRTARRELFLKTWECTPDPEEHLSLWFKGVPVASLRREEVKDFLVWRMWNKLDRLPEDEDELEEYTVMVEQILDHKFPPGRSGHTSMAVTFEPVQMMHRPLLWYVLLIGGADTQMFVTMLWSGFRFYRSSVRNTMLCFPLRPLAWLSNSWSPSPKVSYWHLEHTSKERIPVLLFHALGVGLHFYLQFFQEIKQLHDQHGVGFIAIEVLPVSSRITEPLLHGKEMTDEVYKILRHHGWSRCVVMSHSYGSVTCTHLLRDLKTARLAGPLLFVDPVSFSFHDPHIAWNFLRRQPTTASEIELQYFASMDPDIAYTLTRKFIWPENSIWRDEVENRGKENKCTVALAENDIISNTDRIGQYLTRNQTNDRRVKWYEQERKLRSENGPPAEVDAWKTTPWTGRKQLEVIWYPDLNHSEIFDEVQDRAKILDVLKEYTKSVTD